VTRFAEGPEARTRILENPLYQNVSNTLAGSVEYSAMEKVYEMWESGRYDLIVVDTPPAQHALDFLEAPQRLIEFLESRLVQILIHPAFAAGRFGFRIFQQGARRVLQVLERVSGLSFLEDVSEFLLAFEGMSAGFRERAGRVRSLLLGPEAAFLLVTGPARESVRQAIDFRSRLDAYGVSLEGVLVNRMRAWSGPPPDAGALAEPAPGDLEALAQALAATEGNGPDAPAPSAAEDDLPDAMTAARAAVAAAKGYAALVRRDAGATRELREEVERSGRYWAEIPELPDDVHDLEGLQRIAAAVFSQEEPPSAE
jgi:anion-transporting  ArsA/GET3 family ATPase